MASSVVAIALGKFGNQFHWHSIAVKGDVRPTHEKGVSGEASYSYPGTWGCQCSSGTYGTVCRVMLQRLMAWSVQPI